MRELSRYAATKLSAIGSLQGSMHCMYSVEFVVSKAATGARSTRWSAWTSWVKNLQAEWFEGSRMFTNDAWDLCLGFDVTGHPIHKPANKFTWSIQWIEEHIHKCYNRLLAQRQSSWATQFDAALSDSIAAKWLWQALTTKDAAKLPVDTPKN